jgi:very-short-patch-repair endonuclease
VYKRQSEYRFHNTRKWRFDFACSTRKLAIEIDGGIWSGGRHSGGIGQIKDMEKLNTAAILGWRVLRFTPQQTQTKEFWRATTAFMHGDPHYEPLVAEKRKKKST